jgi:hypothetical protein
MTKLVHLVLAVLLTLALGGCGGNGDRVFVSGPGFVGIDDSDDETFAPFLTVTYIDPVTLLPTIAQILSDPASDGDIAFDPVLGVFTVTTAPLTVFFGVDSLDPNLSEFRAFLTFPLDGVTGQDVVPLGATITNATVELFVTEVSFAGIVPTFLDVVPYRDLGAEDFDAAFLDSRTLDFFSSDAGNFVLIQVTSLMQTAQDLDLLDFQVRFSLDGGTSPTGAQLTRPQAAQKKADRTVSPSSAAGERPARRPPASAPPSGAGPEGPARKR